MLNSIARSILLLILILTPEIHLFASDDLTMGVFPRRNSAITVKMFEPMVKYLEKKTDQNIRLVTARSFPEFWKMVEKGNFDIVHFNQLHYILSRGTSGYEVFAKNEEFGSSEMAPAILVRKDSGITSIADLKNKVIIFGGGKLALVANVGNRLMLREHGFQLSDYRASYARNPPNATLAVFYKQADAAGVGDIALKIESIKRKIDTSKLTFLKVGAYQPHIPWAFSKILSQKIKDNIAFVLLHLTDSKEGRHILLQAGLTNIVSSNDEEFDVTQKLYEKFNKLVNQR